ncbi:MAG: superoxide dismutase [Alphaproteobacteria bacterium]|nr:MAG: superoxide dismutase [Alphaproteobacteria bacterium]
MTNPQPKPKDDKTVSFTLPPLPWPKNALEPHYSSKTLDFHYDKHHKAYVDKANELIVGTGLEGKPLEEVIIEAKKKNLGPLFNNVAQIYNHTLFWESMTPSGGGTPPQPLLDKINESFGSFDKFKEQFVAAGIGQFGSGWVWLVENKGKLEIVKTGNAETPLTDGKTPLLVCDVWEHAYYLDYQNRRADFLKVFVDKLANYGGASNKLKNIKGPKP